MANMDSTANSQLMEVENENIVSQKRKRAHENAQKDKKTAKHIYLFKINE